jgi:hypothetical protein
MNYIPHTLLLTRAQGEQLAALAHHFHKSKSALVRDCLSIHLRLLAEAFEVKTSSGDEISPSESGNCEPMRSIEAPGGFLQKPAENFFFSAKVKPDEAQSADKDSLGDSL